MITAELLTKYGLREADALDAVEMAITRTLTRAMCMNVVVKLNGRLEITMFRADGEAVDLDPKEISRKLHRNMLHNIELELQKRQVCREAEDLEELRGKTLPGEITRIGNDGSLFVDLEFVDLFSRLILAGECPERYQPPHEKGRYRIGEVREFFISSILPVVVNDRLARTRIRLSRITKELPALLLQERTGIYGIECRRRVAGGFSTIITPSRLPKEAINYVGKELGEHLNVFISQTAKK